MATEVKHTPGPWRVDFKSFPYEVEADWNGETIVVAEVPDEFEGDARADAHLIAAAPDMLEALELEQFVEELRATRDPRDIIRLLESRGDYDSGHMDPLGVIDHYQTLAALAREAALAKAKGESA